VKPFTPGKKISRRTVIPIGDPAIPERTWILEFSEHGLGVRHLGTSRRFMRRLPWRSIVAHVIMSNFGTKTEKNK